MRYTLKQNMMPKTSDSNIEAPIIKQRIAEEEKYIYMLILESFLACQRSFKKCKQTYFRKVLVNFVMINKHQLLISSTKHLKNKEKKGKYIFQKS